MTSHATVGIRTHVLHLLASGEWTHICDIAVLMNEWVRPEVIARDSARNCAAHEMAALSKSGYGIEKRRTRTGMEYRWNGEAPKGSRSLPPETGGSSEDRPNRSHS